MSGVPYIRFFGDDWLSGTQELSLEERGALITIVALTSTTGTPPAADFKRLARRFGCTPNKAKKIINSLVELGKIWIENDEVKNARAQKETVFSQKNSKKQSENANARWSKSDGKPNENNEGCDATALPRECQPEPEPEPYKETIATAMDTAGVGGGGIWKIGLRDLKALGMPERTARTAIGKWCKQHSQSEISQAISDAAKNEAADPAAYIEKILTNRERENPNGDGPERKRLSLNVAWDNGEAFAASR